MNRRPSARHPPRGRFQALELGGAAVSKAWNSGWIAAWLTAGVAAAAAADTNAPPAPPAPESPPAPVARALWIGVGRPDADGRAAPGPADAAHLAAAWNAAGGVSQCATGETLSARVVLAELLRLRASARAGDVVAVGYSGPARIVGELDDSRLRLQGIAGEASDAPCTFEDTLLPALADGAFHAAVLIIGHDRIAAAPRAAGAAPTAWRPAGGLPAAAGAFHIWLGATPGQRTEIFGARSAAAAALAWKMNWRKATVSAAALDEWLRAAARRLSLETAGRQAPLHMASAAASAPAAADMDEESRDRLRQLAEALERDAGAADVAAALAAAGAAAADAGFVDLAAMLLAERHRRADDGAERSALAMEIAEVHFRRERWNEAMRWVRAAAAAQPTNSASLGLLASAQWRVGQRLEAAMTAAKALKSPAAAGDAAEERGRIRARIVAGAAAQTQGQAAAARQEFEAAWAAAERDPAVLPAAERLDLCEALAEARMAAGDLAGAESACEEAIIQARALGRHARIPPLRAAIGDARMAEGRTDEAIEAWQEAVGTWPDGRAEPAPADLLIRLGEALAIVGRREEAMARLHEAEKRLGQGPAAAVSAFRIRRAMSRLWRDSGDDLRALHHAREAMEASSRIPGFPAEELAQMSADIAALYARRGEPARSADFARRSLELWSRAAETNLASLASTWVLYGTALGAQKLHADAAAAWSNAAAAQAAAFPDNSLAWARTRLREGRAWIEAGRPDLAQVATEPAVSLVRSPESGATRRDTAEALVLLGRAHAMQDHHEEAVPLFADAIAAAEEGGDDDTAPLLTEALVWAAATSVSQGRYFDARALLSRVTPKLSPTMDKELRALHDRMAAAVDNALEPHGPLGRPGDMAVYEAIETERRIRGLRPPAGSDRRGEPAGESSRQSAGG